MVPRGQSSNPSRVRFSFRNLITGKHVVLRLIAAEGTSRKVTTPISPVKKRTQPAHTKAFMIQSIAMERSPWTVAVRHCAADTKRLRPKSLSVNTGNVNDTTVPLCLQGLWTKTLLSIHSMTALVS